MQEHSTSKKNLTLEQEAIILVEKNAGINAVAGSGKTSTIIEYAAKRPGKKILYIAFNKSVRLEAQRKFSDRGLSNVKIETAHSLAYRHIIPRSNYKIRLQGYKIHEIADLLKLQGSGEKHEQYILANHINKFITYFCNSDKAKVQDLNYLDTIADSKAIIFVTNFYSKIEESTRQILSMMDKAEIEIIHDFYLKKFQLSNPVLNYDYILFDEGQDASSAMLDVFIKQKAIKLIVGDSHQQIYGWRHAVNSLQKTNFGTLFLSASFRFHNDIAELAKSILQWKKHIDAEFKPVQIYGNQTSFIEQSKATIARTNLGLLVSAIDYITDNPKVKHIYFEGNINSYTYADDGASLYDVLNLYNGNFNLIRDKLVKSMTDLDDLEEYIKKTEDVQLSMMVELVKEYGNEIPGIIKSLKDLHTGDDDRSKAEMIFSTVHRAKGMEYDIVYLVNDFINESKLIIPASIAKQGLVDTAGLNEEINLLYVAITRTKNKLIISENLMPQNFPPSPHIQVIKLTTEETESIANNLLKDYKQQFIKKSSGKRLTGMQIKEKAYSVEKKREINRDAYKPWTPELDEELKTLYDSDNPISAIANHFGRTKGAIISRLKKLNYYPE